VTSGIDGIYPKGFGIGKVERLERSGGSFRNIQVQPAVDFTMLEDVLVVLTPSMPEAKPAAELEGAPVPPRPSPSRDPQ
jgi:rod shape-determining protein MreC